MKPHIKQKNGELWIFSSKQASLHAMPLYKCISMTVVMVYLNMMKVNVK